METQTSTLVNESILSITATSFATFCGKTYDGQSYIYKIRYSVDAKKVVQRNAFKVLITVRKTNPDQEIGAPVFSNLNYQNIVNNILLYSSRRTRLYETYNSSDNLLFKVNSDITKSIPNNLLIQLADPNNTDLLFSKTVIEPVSYEEYTRKLNNTTIPQVNHFSDIDENQNTKSDLLNSITVQRLALKSILNYGVDPAIIGDNGGITGVIPASLAINGITTDKISSDSSKIKLLEREFPNHPVVSLVKKFINASNTSAQQQLISNVDARQSAVTVGNLIPVLKTIQTNNVEVEETIEFPINTSGSDDLFIKLELIDVNNRIIQIENTVLKHSSVVSTLSQPKQPPLIEVFSPTYGQNVLSITQVDPLGTKVKIYRKTISLSKVKTVANSGYTLIGELELTTNTSPRKFVDLVDNSVKHIYRVIPVGPQNTTSHVFSSAVSTIKRNMFLEQAMFQTKNITCAISSENVSNGIEIKISNFDDDIVGLRILKKHLSTYENEYTAIGDLIQLENITYSYRFVDHDVIKNDVYQYSCKFFYENGDVIDSSSQTTIEYNPLTVNIVNTTISTPNVSSNPTEEIDVVFSVSSEVVKNDNRLLNTALAKAGLTSYFSDEITDIQDEIQKLIVHEVKRINTNTGESETFGIIPTDTFSDRLNGKLASAKPLERGHTYRYDVIPLLRSPGSLFETNYKIKPTTKHNVYYPLQGTIIGTNVSQSTVTNTSTWITESVTKYSYSPYKWEHPAVLQESTIFPNKQTLIKSFGKSEFQFGNIGSVSSINVSLANIKPEITNLVASLIFKKTFMVSWSINGSQDLIDHFLITINSFGGKEILGKTHNVSNNNQYVFIYTIPENYFKGTVTISITPIYFDYEYGNNISSNEIVLS